MKLKELKHNHSLTDLLKVLIFSILMITPLLSVATRCLYVICNKNAYKNFEKSEVISLKPILNQSDLIQDYKYTIEYYERNIAGNSPQIKYTDISINWHDYNENITNEDVNQFIIRYNGTDNIIYLYNEGVYKTAIYGWGNTIKGFSFTFDSLNDPNNFNQGNQRITYITYLSETLDNVFEYSVNKLAQSPILSWTQQTAIYTGVNTMTTQLGVNAQTIPMLIVYWFMLTVIYIIIDIIIKLFTWLTHMIGSKSV